MRSTGSSCVNSDDLNACADLVRRADPERFRAAMAAPVAARQVLFPLYAFNAEVARAPWVTAEPMIAEMRLQWWRDVLEEIRAGGAVRRHEVATPLAQVIDAEATVLLDDLVLARRWDAYRDPFEDEAAFEAYLTHTAGHLMWVSASALGADMAARSDVMTLGYAHGLAGYLRALPALEAKGRVPLVDGRPEAVEALAQTGLDGLKRMHPARKMLSQPARAALLPVWNSKAILRAARADFTRVRDGTLDVSPMRSRLMLMLHAARLRF